MPRISFKRIKGKKYAYLAQSIRLSNGKITTITKRLAAGEEKRAPAILGRKYQDYFSRKESELAAKWALKNYETSYLFSEEEIRKIEAIRISYSRLMKKLSREQLRDVLNRFTANFTYDSNAIEGNSLTLKDVAVVIFEQETIPNKPLREIYETRNSSSVIDLIFQKKFKIAHSGIIHMHHILMKDIDPRKGYKKLPNIIYRTEKEVHTTPPEKVKDEMTKLMDWFNTSRLHPLERAAVFHGRFEKIHPFEDGNGRVGRFLINVMLVNNGYPPLIIRKTSRAAYMSALAAFDSDHEDNLKRFVLERFKETYRKFFEVYTKYV